MGADRRIRPHGGSSGSDSYRVVVFSVSFYIVTAIAMILVNKAVLNTVDLPLLFLLLQMVIAVIIMRVGHKLGVYHCPKIDRSISRRLIPMVGANVLGLSLNTLCLQYVDASFYQVARSLILPFTLFQNWIFLGQRSSIPVLVCCSIIFSGFLIGTLMDHRVVQSINLGILFGILSSITTSFHAVVIKSSVDAVRGSTLALVYYNNVLSTFAMLPVVFYTGEVGKLLAMVRTAWPAMVRNFRWSSFIFAGMVGFMINIAGFLQIKVTSPVSHMISSAVRGVLQTVLAVAILGESTSLPRNVGIILILLGSCAYTWLKAREARVVLELLDPKTRKMEKP
ncbi:hypothetical protein BJ742DRAFT_705447 [Cladochytrium replicatum]|nr:hypothetical protein BJ742DRAFT_705447 [Cladochytrium replicatum]